MLKAKLKSLVAGTLLSLILVGCGSSVEPTTQTESPENGGDGEEMLIRISYNLPAEHATGQYFEILAEEIKKNTAETSIQLNPTTFPNGQLYNDQQLPDAISNALVEIGQLNIGFLAGEYAESLSIVDLPFLFNSWDALWAAEDGEFSEIFNDQFERYNMRAIGFVPYGTVEYYANEPIQIPEDLKGLKMRAFGQGSSQTLQTLEASPVSMSSQEVYQAMDHGIIDGYSSGPSSVIDRGLHEVTTHGTDIKLNYLSFPAVVNLSWWNELPEDVQNAVLEASHTALEMAREKTKDSEEQYLQQLLQHGVEIYTPSQEEMERWREAVQADYDNYLDRTGELGELLLGAAEKANEAQSTN